MSFSQISEAANDSFLAPEYFKNIAPLNKTAKFLFNVDTDRVAVIKNTPVVGDILAYQSTAAGTWGEPDEMGWAAAPGDTDLESVAVQNWGAGSSRVINGARNVLIGDSVNTGGSGDDKVCLGYAASSTASESICIGPGATNTGGVQSVIVGPFSLAQFGTRNIVLGYSSVASNGGIAVGPALNVQSTASSIAVGKSLAVGSVGPNYLMGESIGALTTGAFNIGIGNQCLQTLTTGSRNIGIGRADVKAAGTSDSVALGDQTTVATQGVSLGALCISGPERQVAVGYDNGSLVASTAVNNVIIGFACAKALTTSSNNVLIGNAAGDNLTVSGNNVIIGTSTNLQTGSGSCIAIGVGSNFGAVNSNRAIAIGDTANAATAGVALGANSQATANQNVAIGEFAQAFNTECIAIGPNAAATGIRTMSIGGGVANAVASSCLIGSSTSPSTYQVRSTGLMKSFQSVGGAAGRVAADGSQAIPAFPAIVTIASVRYEYPIGLRSGNDMFLGEYPYDNDSTFMVSANINATASVAARSFRLEILWSAPGIAGTPFVVAYQTVDCVNSTDLSCSLCRPIRVPAASTGRNSVSLRIQNLTGPVIVTIIDYSLQINRLA
jgi:hypothetical protein